MAKLPGYIRAEGRPYSRDGQALQDFRILTWHPSLLRDLWRMLDVRPRVVKPVGVLAVWLRLNWKAARAH